MQSRGLGVGVRSQSAASFQHRHGVLQHDPLLLFSGLVHVDSCDAHKEETKKIVKLKMEQKNILGRQL